jgi:hypothetical protein
MVAQLTVCLLQVKLGRELAIPTAIDPNPSVEEGKKRHDEEAELAL